MARRKGKAGRSIATYEHPEQEAREQPARGLGDPGDRPRRRPTRPTPMIRISILISPGPARPSTLRSRCLRCRCTSTSGSTLHAIIEAVRRTRDADEQGSLFATPEENPPLRQAIEFYRHRHNWTNRLIAGDSLLVMNSLIEKEGLGGQVQMVYMDPPYGIRLRLQLPAFREPARSDRRQGCRPDRRARADSRVPGHLGTRDSLVPILSCGTALLLARELLP